MPLQGEEWDWMILMGSFQASAFCDSVKSSSCSPAGWCPQGWGCCAGDGGSAQAGPHAEAPHPHPAPEVAQEEQFPMDTNSETELGRGVAPCLAGGRWLSSRTVPSLGTRSLQPRPGEVTAPNGRFSREEAACEVPAPLSQPHQLAVTG